MKVHWDLANARHNRDYGRHLRPHVPDVVDRINDGERHRDRVLELLDRSGRLTSSEYECIKACSEED